MADGNLPQNTLVTDPELADLIAAVKKSLMLNMNCCQIGTVQAFNAQTQTAKVTINYQKTIQIFNTETEQNVQVNVPYPIIADAPVWFARGGAAGVSLPVASGDECVVLFDDRDIDNWHAGQINGAPASSRLHSFPDALIFVGIGNLNNVIANFDTVRALLYNGTAGVGVGASLIKIYNSQYTLNGLLQELITEITNITVAVTSAPGTSGPPLNASEITDTANKIAGLLE
jgi:hypothetical protein